MLKETLDSKPLYTTGVAAKIIGIKPKTLLNYENAKLVQAQRSDTGRRLFSKSDIFKILLIRYLIIKQNVSFDGIRLILKMIESSRKKGVDLLESVIPSKVKEKFVKEIESL